MTPARATWTGYAAAAWAFVFAVLHVVWAMGFYVGLDRMLSREAFAHRWFLVYDLVIAGVCALAVWVALGLVRPWGRARRRLVLALAWSGTAVLVLRGGAGALQTAYLAAIGRDVWGAYRLWEAWFVLGAILFALGTWRFWQADATWGAAHA